MEEVMGRVRAQRGFSWEVGAAKERESEHEERTAHIHPPEDTGGRRGEGQLSRVRASRAVSSPTCLKCGQAISLLAGS
jgi:hypothetical protein